MKTFEEPTIINLVDYLQGKLPEFEKEYRDYYRNGLRTGYWPFKIPRIVFIERVLEMAGRLPGESEAA